MDHITNCTHLPDTSNIDKTIIQEFERSLHALICMILVEVVRLEIDYDTHQAADAIFDVLRNVPDESGAVPAHLMSPKRGAVALGPSPGRSAFLPLSPLVYDVRPLTAASSLFLT